MDADKIFNQAMRELAAHAGVDQKQIAARLYEIYGLKGSFDAWHSHVRKCFSNDSRERFDFCDVFVLMHEYQNFAPLFAMCDLLKLSRPELLSNEEQIRSQLEKLDALAASLEEAKRELDQLQAISTNRVTDTPIRLARFSAPEKQ